MSGLSIDEAFERDGYLLIEDFFAADPVEELDALIRAHYGDDPAFRHTDEFLGRSRTEVIPWFPLNEKAAAFESVGDDARLSAVTGAVLGHGWRPLYCMVMFSKAGTAGQAWHQDCAPDDPAVFNLNRLVYSADIDDASGGQTVVVPGSHRRGLIPAGDPQAAFDGQRVLCPKKGSLLLLHGHTWHRVLPVTGSGRYSTNYRALPPGVTNDPTDVCVYRNMRYRFSTERVIEERVA